MAQAYYQSQRHSITPTIETLKLSRQLKKTIAALAPEKPFDPDAYVAFLNCQKQLKGLGKAIAIAEPEKKEALGLAEKTLAETEQRLIDSSVKNLAGAWNVSKTAEVLKTLKRAADIYPELGNAQETIAAAMVASAADFSKQLSGIVRKSFTFKNGPSIERAALSKAESKLRTINSSLLYVSSKMFGKYGQKARESLVKQSQANTDASKAAQTLSTALYLL